MMLFKLMVTGMFFLSVGCAGKGINPTKDMSDKQYCILNGGNWEWSSARNKWSCIGFDMSSFYKIKYKDSYRDPFYKEERKKCKQTDGEWFKNKKTNKWECKYRTRYQNNYVVDNETGIKWLSLDVHEFPELSWIEAKKYCENISIDGGKWRLPYNDELWFAPLKNFKPELPFWTNYPSFKYDKNKALMFKYDKSRNVFYNLYEDKQKKHLVTCVKTKRNNNKLIYIPKKDVVVDLKRKLMWQNHTKLVRHDSFFWNICAKSQKSGYTDWRLPSLSELISIADHSKKPALNSAFKTDKNLHDDFRFCWSNTNTYGYDFSEGKLAYGSSYDYEPYRCVRNLKKGDLNEINNYNTKPIGSTNFKNAKYLNGIIWEDQPVNKKFDMTYKECKQHCQSLDLLGIQKWHIPTLSEYRQIIDGTYRKLDNLVPPRGYHATLYLTADRCTDLKKKISKCFFSVDFNSDEKIKQTRTAMYDFSCRCALSVKDYNAMQNNKITNLHKKKDKNFRYFIDKFYINDDGKLLQKAEKLARTREEKSELEKAYIRFVGNYWKVFKLYSKSLIPAKNNIEHNKFLFVIGISDYRKAKYKVTLKQNPDSPVPLKYGRYLIKVKFILNISYESNSGLGTFTVHHGRYDKIEKSITFKLSPQNHYKDTKVIDFGEIEVSSRGEVAFIDVENKIISMDIETKIVEVK